MKLIHPDDPDLPENRTDTCTACHQDNNREARAYQLQDWHAWYKESMDPLQADLATINSALKEKPDLLLCTWSQCKPCRGARLLLREQGRLR